MDVSQIPPPPQGFLPGQTQSAWRGMAFARAPFLPEPLKFFLTAVTCHRFQSADMSAHSKTPSARHLPLFHRSSRRESAPISQYERTDPALRDCYKMIRMISLLSVFASLRRDRAKIKWRRDGALHLWHCVFYNDASPDGLRKFVLIREIRVKPSASLQCYLPTSSRPAKISGVRGHVRALVRRPAKAGSRRRKAATCRRTPRTFGCGLSRAMSLR
jgi:hypothetical protein